MVGTFAEEFTKLKPYPQNIDEDNTVESLRQISRLRNEDITDRNNFPAVFLSGRSVGKVPTSSTDIAITDRVGDVSFAVDGSYIYFFVNLSGTPTWTRIVLGTW